MQVLKQKGVIKNTAKDHIHVTVMSCANIWPRPSQFLNYSLWSHSLRYNIGLAAGITCLLEQRLAFQYIWTQLMEGLRKTTPILVNPQLLTRLLYTAAELPMPDPATSTEANLLSTLRKSFIVGDEAIVKTIKKDRGSSIPPAVPATVSKPEPSIQAQQSASVQEVGESSNLARTLDQGLQIVGVKRHEAEHFSIQQLLHPTPVNCKQHHEASTYFEGFSQKLQQLSTEPPPNIPDEEEEGVEEILEDTAGTVVLATHLVMEQSMKRIEKLIAKKTKAVEASYEAQLQQLRTESASSTSKAGSEGCSTRGV